MNSFAAFTDFIIVFFSLHVVLLTKKAKRRKTDTCESAKFLGRM